MGDQGQGGGQQAANPQQGAPKKWIAGRGIDDIEVDGHSRSLIFATANAFGDPVYDLWFFEFDPAHDGQVEEADVSLNRKWTADAANDVERHFQVLLVNSRATDGTSGRCAHGNAYPQLTRKPTLAQAPPVMWRPAINALTAAYTASANVDSYMSDHIDRQAEQTANHTDDEEEEEKPKKLNDVPKSVKLTKMPEKFTDADIRTAEEDVKFTFASLAIRGLEPYIFMESYLSIQPEEITALANVKRH